MIALDWWDSGIQAGDERLAYVRHARGGGKIHALRVGEGNRKDVALFGCRTRHHWRIVTSPLPEHDEEVRCPLCAGGVLMAIDGAIDAILREKE